MNIRLGISDKEKVRVVAALADAWDRALLVRIAAAEDWKLQLVNSTHSALEDLKRRPAVVLCDGDWRSIVDALRTAAPLSRFILASPTMDDRLWLEVLERGGYDVITRPFHARRLIDSVTLAWRETTK